jgi:hypothetical protein
VLANEYGRSLDPKFQKDSEVFILLEPGTKLSYSDIHQMFGRGCRSQGHGKGTIFI